MESKIKTLVIGVVPTVCGLSTVVAHGEKIAWPEAPSPKLSFQAAVTPAAAVSAEDQLRQAREAALQAELMRIRMMQLPIVEEIDGIRR